MSDPEKTELAATQVADKPIDDSAPAATPMAKPPSVIVRPSADRLLVVADVFDQDTGELVCTGAGDDKWDARGMARKLYVEKTGRDDWKYCTEECSDPVGVAVVEGRAALAAIDAKVAELAAAEFAADGFTLTEHQLNQRRDMYLRGQTMHYHLGGQTVGEFRATPNGGGIIAKDADGKEHTCWNAVAFVARNPKFAASLRVATVARAEREAREAAQATRSARFFTDHAVKLAAGAAFVTGLLAGALCM